MKFQLIVVVCLIFYTYDSANFKKTGITPWKCYSLLRWPQFITGCAQQTFTVQNKPAAVAPKEPSPIISSFFWNWAEENCRCSQTCGGAEMLLKQNPANTVNGLLGFITLGIYIYSACVLLNNCMSCPMIWATLSANSLINMASWPLPVVFA